MQLQTNQQLVCGEMPSILHIGMPKTGSTTLQRTLHASNTILEEHGICYPSNLKSSPASHRIMASKLMPASRFPRHLHRCKQQQRADELYLELKAKIDAAKQQGKARQVVLSSEILFRLPDNGYKSYFRDSVYDLLGNQLRIAAYLRSPASAYLALLQQKLKASHRLRPVKPPEYKKVIKFYCDHFGRNAISLRIFDRGELVSGDIVSDFCEHYLPAHPDLVAQLQPSVETNVSLSAESMAVCLLFHKKFFAVGGDKRTKLSRRLISGLRQADALVQAERPTLLPAIRDGIDRVAAPQMHWLRRQWCLEFNNYDYSYSAHDKTSAEWETLDGAKSLDQIVCIDYNLIRGIARVLMTETKLAEVRKIAQWSEMLASSSPSEILEMLAA